MVFRVKLFIDESGYTGEDLINEDQPFYALASNNLDNNEAATLIDEFFDGIRSTELKHKELGKAVDGQDRIVGLIKAFKESPGRVTSTLAHKEYELINMLVEWWVEPYLWEDGIDLYDKGANIGMVNLAYLTLRSTIGPALLMNHLAKFQTMMRERTPERYREFWELVKSHYGTSHAVLDDVLSWFIYGEQRLGWNHLIVLPQKILDIAMTTAACTINHWRSNSEGPFDLIHDTSSKMAGEKWLWDQLVSPSLEAKVVGHDRRKWIFPLNVASTTFLDSKEVPQLQLSDLVAGATAMWARARWDDSLRSAYTDRLDEAGISEFIINISWPTEHVTPEDLGTDTLNAESAADFIGKKIKVPKAKRRKRSAS